MLYARLADAVTALNCWLGSYAGAPSRCTEKKRTARHSEEGGAPWGTPPDRICRLCLRAHVRTRILVATASGSARMGAKSLMSSMASTCPDNRDTSRIFSSRDSGLSLVWRRAIPAPSHSATTYSTHPLGLGRYPKLRQPTRTSAAVCMCITAASGTWPVLNKPDSAPLVPTVSVSDSM